MKSSGVHRFAVFTSFCILLLLAAGALVTSNGAGLSVPDWPLSYGSLMPPMVGGIIYEHSHRVIATFVGIFSIVLAVWLWRVEPRRWVRWLGVTAVGLVIAQGVLGGITVLYLLPPAISSSHATLAQLFFITVIALAVFTSPWWQSDLPQLEDTGSPGLRSLTVWTTLAIVVQLFLGAGFRHNAFGIQPHFVGAAVVTGMVVWTGRAVRNRFRNVKDLRRWGLYLHSALGVQLLLGGAAYWITIATREIPRPTEAFVVLTVLHVLGGAVLLATSFILTLRTFRLVHSPATVQLESPAHRASA